MKSTRILSLLLCLALLAAAVFTLGACNLDDLEITGEGKYEFTADGKQDSVDLLISFFDGTVQNVEEGEVAEEVNFVVTMKKDGAVYATETVDGEKECIRMTNGYESDTYSLFKRGEEYIVAWETGETKLYSTKKDAYDASRFSFLNALRAMNELVETEGATFQCVSVMEDSDYVTKDVQETHSTAELDFDYNSEKDVVHIHATAENGLVQNCTITRTLNGVKHITELTFVYGNASVTVPDITDWQPIDAGVDIE